MSLCVCVCPLCVHVCRDVAQRRPEHVRWATLGRFGPMRAQEGASRRWVGGGDAVVVARACHVASAGSQCISAGVPSTAPQAGTTSQLTAKQSQMLQERALEAIGAIGQGAPPGATVWPCWGSPDILLLLWPHRGRSRARNGLWSHLRFHRQTGCDNETRGTGRERSG